MTPGGQMRDLLLKKIRIDKSNGGVWSEQEPTRADEDIWISEGDCCSKIFSPHLSVPLPVYKLVLLSLKVKKGINNQLSIEMRSLKMSF